MIDVYPADHGALANLVGTDHHTQYTYWLPSNTLANRPAAARPGRLFKQTDGTPPGRIWVDDGTAWSPADGLTGSDHSPQYTMWLTPNILANRPAAGRSGRLFRQTDGLPAGRVWLDDGTTWQPIDGLLTNPKAGTYARSGDPASFDSFSSGVMTGLLGALWVQNPAPAGVYVVNGTIGLFGSVAGIGNLRVEATASGVAGIPLTSDYRTDYQQTMNTHSYSHAIYHNGNGGVLINLSYIGFSGTLTVANAACRIMIQYVGL